MSQECLQVLKIVSVAVGNYLSLENLELVAGTTKLGSGDSGGRITVCHSTKELKVNEKLFTGNFGASL